MTEILWVDPVGHDDFSGDIEALLQNAARDSTSVDVASLDRGPHHVEYHYYEALVTPDVLHTVKRAENNGYDATVIGCFYDLGLEAAREVSDAMPVAAPAEATTHLAATLGASFSVVVGRQKWIPQMRERIHAYGFRDQLASFRPVDLGVLDFQDDPETTKSRLRDAARSAVEEDGAEVIILGCTAEYGFHEELQSDLGVPVLDAVTAPFKYAELLADLAELGWTHSKVGGYESPRPDEITCWGITDDYSNADVWSDEETT
ncbi:aspartate/glutamate racemase family protein [Haloferax volcanii]|uniref:Hydantoin racemase n=3 Tax=Haloferax volcanii TaxID=2246 RepID=A0A384L676_HALVD|nr:aspartate/glutamate racemase family protein [Haloferax volcanii]ADE02107.1 hydantoin racemase [Haloferax volcanii DS2]ELY30773.1 hydantoin racemase [Haloferax volcanii DS2]MBS8120993.1 hydantoin racemase [Haloferax volcanii]MBS8126030.1 hydantoin racemase [Haloferax volcanii]MBS8129883.1 hydantoin racemase [Haloferax volcanii]